MPIIHLTRRKRLPSKKKTKRSSPQKNMDAYIWRKPAFHHDIAEHSIFLCTNSESLHRTYSEADDVHDVDDDIAK